MGMDGSYDVYIWWTEFSNRCTDVQVEVSDATGVLDSVVVNQKANGGQWNYIGSYSFVQTGRVRVVSSGGGCTTSADAVRFVPM
jgi:hypothetical protein